MCAATGPHVQGVLALSDNFERDGGTVLVPGFHATFDEWSAALGPKDAYVDAHDDKRRNHLVWRGDGAGSFKFGDNDAAHRLKVRIPVREGSFLIWDQRVCHGSAPNDSDRARIAQFLKGFPKGRRRGGKVRAARRARRGGVGTRGGDGGGIGARKTRVRPGRRKTNVGSVDDASRYDFLSRAARLSVRRGVTRGVGCERTGRYTVHRLITYNRKGLVSRVHRPLGRFGRDAKIHRRRSVAVVERFVSSSVLIRDAEW